VAQGSSTDGLQFGVSGAHPTSLLRAGLTVYFTDLKRLVPRSQPWLRHLEASLGLPECASVMAFANAPGSGLTLHHDRYDQLFFQLRGTKSFRYAPNHYLQNPDIQFSPGSAAHVDFGARYRKGFPLSCAEVLEQPFQEIELAPGSAFFMPAGTWHTTAEQRGEALSLVVAVRAPSRLALLQNLLDCYVSQSPEWRERAYGYWHPELDRASSAHAGWAPLVADLAGRLQQLLATDARDAWSAQQFALGGQSQYPQAARFRRYIRLPNSSLSFEADPDAEKVRCVVASGPSHRPQMRTVLSMHAQARPIVDWVLSARAAFTSQEVCAAFSDFDPEEVETMLGWLAGAALIRPLPGPDWSE
jgi:hypothetical protein